ncbi:MAG: hypothetical protein ACYS1C_11555 [Planctomycetota bacterium]|jgi:hypothetical protein
MPGPTNGPLVSADQKSITGIANFRARPTKPAPAAKKAFKLKPYFGTRFRIHRRLGKPVLYEFRPGTSIQAVPLTYMPKAKRTYYRPGDMVFQCEMDQKMLYRIHPGLAPRKGKESLLLTIAKGLLFPPSPPPYYKVATVITRIKPWGNSGNGCIYGSTVVFFGDSPVQLSNQKSWSVPQFQEAANHVKLSKGLIQMAKLCETVSQVVMEVGVALATGGASAAGRGLARKGVKAYVLRRGALLTATKEAAEYAAVSIGRQMLRRLPGALAKATLAFAKEFGAYMSSANAEKKLRALALKKDTAALRRDPVLRNAVMKGCVAFATTLVGETLGFGLGEVINKSDIIKSAVGKFVADRLCQLMFLQSWQSLAKVLVDTAVEMSQGKAGKKTYGQVLAGKLASEGKSLLGNEAKGILGKIPPKIFGG